MVAFAAVLVGAAVVAASAQTYPAPALVLTPFHPSGIYRIGEPAGWSIHAGLGAGYTKYSYELTENNLTPIETGVLDLSSGLGAISTVLNHPGMLYLRLHYTDLPSSVPAPTEQQLDKMTAGAAVAPELIRPPLPKPADFDSFWAEKLAALKRVPIHPRPVPTASDRDDVALFTVTLDSLDSQVHGYLATPKDGAKHPALIIYQYAGVYPLEKNTVTDRAAEGWLAFDVDAHDMAPDQATAPLDYASIGNTSRETSYFLNMYLRDTRALDYIETRPDWDGRTIVLLGTSMGAQQSFATAGLNPGRVTAIITNVPAGANISGDLHGARRGFPNWTLDDPRVVETARYFDIMNFAPAIEAESLVAFGFIDTTAPPFGILAAFNEIPGPKEAVPMPLSDHNHITPEAQGSFYIRSREALEALRQGGHFTPSPNGFAP